MIISKVAMTEQWEDLLKRALTRHDTRMSHLAQQADSVHRNLENLNNRLGNIEQELEAEIEGSRTKIAEIISWKMIRSSTYEIMARQIFTSTTDRWAADGRTRGV
jgi:hypothetical protein